MADGEMLRDNLRRRRMTVEELRAEARPQSIASLDVRFAMLEGNGRISFINR